MRFRKPWFRTSKDAWFVEIDGRQVRLAKGAANEKAAHDAFYRLMATRPDNLPPPAEIRVAVLCDTFLCHSEKHNEPETFRWYQSFLQDFCKLHGRKIARDLKPIHVTLWLDTHPDWKGGRRNAVIAVKRAFNWADEQGVLSPNPIRNVVKPSANRRTRILTKEELSQILAAIRDRPFRDFVTALIHTGCRPGEVARLTAENVNLEIGVWTFEQHKSAKRTGKPRVVYLTPAMVEISRALMERFPVGPLFRSNRGKAFSRQAIRCRFRRLRDRLPHLKHFVCYNLRHTYATDALAAGVSAAQVAELLGHSSIRMIEQHYGHLSQKVRDMRTAALKAAS